MLFVLYFICTSNELPILRMEYNKRLLTIIGDLFVCLFVQYFLPNDWVYRVKNEVEEREGKGFGHSLADIT